jgi:hypothetical protein
MAVVVPSSREREMRSRRSWPLARAKETLRKWMAGVGGGVVKSDLLAV